MSEQFYPLTTSDNHDLNISSLMRSVLNEKLFVIIFCTSDMASILEEPNQMYENCYLNRPAFYFNIE